ncbi:spore coat U domain-containing protein [Bradyrhizobium sp. LTSP885]|uniref:Csu type fimbrial protein n=1 Tax=Bradyrhizobium sp. LTSP885 TaxID=1619232 RepID=UPI0005CB6591|nr:spore coat U domain-containing protein [Bradyrhizobium sp. LTSP885]
MVRSPANLNSDLARTVQCGTTTVWVLLAAMTMFACRANAQSCSVSAAAGNYGSVNILSGGTTDTTSSFTVNCTGCLSPLGCTYNVCVQFDQGSPNSNSSIRYMGSGASTIQHELYSDAARTQVWGSWGYGASQYGAAGISLNLTIPFLSNASQNFTVYGRIKAGQQTTVPGTYTWNTTSPALAGAAYLLASPNCSANPGNFVNAGSSPWVATILANCNLSATPLNFGSASLLTSNVDAVATLTVQCTNTTPYSIGLDSGANASGSQRRMLNGASNHINYNLYTDAARSAAWSTTTSASSCTNGTGTCVLGTGTGSNQNVTVYGRVPPQVAPAVGTYSDTVIATITF